MTPAPDGFDTFWACYPRRANKQAARDAFRWAMQHFNEDGQLLSRIQSALVWQIAENPDPQFWVLPDKYLLKERWTDEPIVRVVVPTSRERADYRLWIGAVGTALRERPTLEQWVSRQRKGAA